MQSNPLRWTEPARDPRMRELDLALNSANKRKHYELRLFPKAPPVEVKNYKLPADVLLVIQECASARGLTVGVILGPSRLRPVVQARHAAIRALRRMGFSEICIGQFVRRDHSAVHYALKGR